MLKSFFKFLIVLNSILLAGCAVEEPNAAFVAETFREMHGVGTLLNCENIKNTPPCSFWKLVYRNGANDTIIEVWLFHEHSFLYSGKVNRLLHSVVKEKYDSLRDSLKSLTGFSINFHDSVFESIQSVLSNDNSETAFKNDYCWGDCCGSYKIFQRSDSSFYFFKSYCGEYGYSNDQFFFTQNVLQRSRTFNFSVLEYHSDLKNFTYLIEEKIHDFSGINAIIKERSKTFTNFLICSIDDVPFKTSIQKKDSLFKDQNNQFKMLIELEEKYKDTE
ncbi:MAG: hypothetical protein K0S32_1347 [Bacteroidetes bacterium]|nr:hypothetical protein [Bacteroidota bacterium]